MGTIQIHLPKPCHENWDLMTPAEKGRFCQACQKTVYDFTRSSDRQIIQHLESNQATCGRFLASQLDRDLVVQTSKSNRWAVVCSGFLSLFAFASQEVTAQTKQEWVKINSLRDKYNRVPIPQQKGMVDSVPMGAPIKISGTVIDGGIPVPAANITIKGTEKDIQTDFDGKFTIEALSGDTLRVSFLGYSDYEMRLVKSEDALVVDMEPMTQYLGGDVGIVVFKRRTFVGRQILRIRNWFR